MNITLIGMAGVGKSLIGKVLAKRLGYSFIDTDRIIEKNARMKLQAILDRYGKDRFLKLEERTVLNLTLKDRSVVSPGGSIVYSPKAMRFLKRHSVVVFLDAPFGSIDSWIADKTTRGIIGLKRKGLRDLYRERRPLYGKFADMTVRLRGDHRKHAVAARIIRKIFGDTRFIRTG